MPAWKHTDSSHGEILLYLYFLQKKKKKNLELLLYAQA